MAEARLKSVEKKVGWEEMETVSRDNSREAERQSCSWRGCAGQGKFCKKVVNFSVF